MLTYVGWKRIYTKTKLSHNFRTVLTKHNPMAADTSTSDFNVPFYKGSIGNESTSQTYGTSFSPDGKPSVELDITAAMGPGVYVIIDMTTGKGYYGESEELGLRLGRHKNALEDGIHDNSALQQAWDEVADPTKFSFVILEWGSVWKDQNLRKAKETSLIQANANNCFNILSDNAPRGIIRPIMINGIRYDSSRDAARKLKRARTDILRELKNKAKPDSYYLPTENYGSIPVFIQIGKDGKEGPILLFPSMTAVVEAGFATSKQMVRRRIQSSTFSNWRYAALDASGNPIRKPYPLQPGDMSYEEYLAKYSSSNNKNSQSFN